jgi:outer membrane protein assembly factor BamD (BamD/ComL family)
MGYLLYRLSMAFILDENYDDAMDVLTAFMERFPEHPDYQDASDMIDSLTERARFTSLYRRLRTASFRLLCHIWAAGVKRH